MSDTLHCPVCSTWAGSLDPAALAGHRPHCPLGAAEADYAALQSEYERAIESHTEEERLHWNAVAATERVEERLTAAVAENERLHRELTAFADRIASQADQLAQNAARDAMKRLEAWQKAEGWREIECRIYAEGGVCIEADSGPRYEEVEAFACPDAAKKRRRDTDRSDVVIVGTDEKPASNGECLLAAIDLWQRLHGEAAQKGGG